MSVELIAVWLHISQMLALGTPPVAAPTPLTQPDLVVENERLRAEVARLRGELAHGLD